MSWLNKDPLSKIDIKYKLPLGFIALYLFVFGFGGYFVINSVYAPLNQEIMQRLKSESLAQATLFDKKLEMLAQRSEDFSSDGFIRNKTAELIPSISKQPVQNLLVKSTIRELKIHLSVNKLPLIDEFVDLLIYDLDNNQIVSVNNESFDIQSRLINSFQNKNQFFSSIMPPNDIYSFPTTAIITPLWNIEHNKKIGYLACIINLKTLIKNLLLEHQSVLSANDMEKYLTLIDHSGIGIELSLQQLGNKDRQEYTSSILEEHVIFKFISSNPAKPLSLHNGRHICKDEKEMYGQSYPLASVGWSTLIELKAGDALKPLIILESKLLGVAIIVALITFVLLFFPVQFLIKPLAVLRKMASRIKEGDFSVRNKIKSDDEIGQLAKTFNMMTAAIEERTSKLQKTASDLQNSERELRVEHNRLNAVVQFMSDGLILFNSEGKIILTNKSADPIVQMLHHFDESQTILKCTHSENEQQCLRCLLDTNCASSCVLTINDRILELLTTKFPSAKGAYGKLLVIRDITEREQMHKRQAHQDRLTALGKTAAVVAHEMNSPLAAISMYNQMMESELEEGSQFLEHVDVIKRNSETCQKIIKELLDYAKTPQPKIEKIDLHQILLNVIRFVLPLIKEKNVSIEHHFLANNSELLADATQMQQVFINLLMNASQAAPVNKGVIRIETGEKPKGNFLFVDVIDNGSGINKKIIKEIYEPFFTANKAGGTGLGLTTAKRIIKAHGGDLELLRSKHGETVFRVMLPLSKQR